MKIHGRSYRTIWPGSDGHSVEVIDQIQLPHRFATRRLETLEDAADAIRSMVVRGAPLIGVTAAYGIWLALRRDASDAVLEDAIGRLAAPHGPLQLRAQRPQVRVEVPLNAFHGADSLPFQCVHHASSIPARLRIEYSRERRNRKTARHSQPETVVTERHE